MTNACNLPVKGQVRMNTRISFRAVGTHSILSPTRDGKPACPHQHILNSYRVSQASQSTYYWQPVTTEFRQL